jgi:prefoldin subunit 5
MEQAQSPTMIEAEITAMDRQLDSLRSRALRYTRDVDRENCSAAIDALRQQIRNFQKAHTEFRESSRYLWGVSFNYQNSYEQIRKSFSYLMQRYA